MQNPPFEIGSDQLVKASVTMPTPDVTTLQGTSAEELWLPVNMPSMGLAGYPTTLYVRKFVPTDIVRLSVAKKTSSFSDMVNAIGATIKGVDPALLTTGDFDYLLYWHHTMSYSSSRTKVTWLSRYFHENVTVVDRTMRKVTHLEDANIIKEWQDKGYDFPRIGDDLWKITQQDAGTLTSELEEKLKLATYVQVANPADVMAKMAVIDTMKDISFYENLDDWRTIAYHGVTDTVKLRCSHFKPEKAEEDITRHLQWLQINDYALDAQTFSLSQSLLEELATIKKLEAEGLLHTATPVEEEVSIPLDVNNFFPVAL